MILLNLSSIRPCTESEGPGKRFAIWCQGCLNRCPGCCNPEMQPIEQKHVVSVEDLEKLISDTVKTKGIEGVSFIGGEPFLQAKGLSVLAKWCQNNNLSVLVFTGYTLKELQTLHRDGTDELLKYTDLLVDGRYDEQQFDDERPWVGSKNQKVYYLSERYSKGVEYQAQRSMEMLISDDAILLNGWPY